MTKSRFSVRIRILNTKAWRTSCLSKKVTPSYSPKVKFCESHFSMSLRSLQFYRNTTTTRVELKLYINNLRLWGHSTLLMPSYRKNIKKEPI